MSTRSCTTSMSYSIASKKPKRKSDYKSTIKLINTINCVLTFFLFFSSFERLEWLADKPLIELHSFLPYSLLKLSILIDDYSQPLVYMGLLFHLLSMKLSTTQAIMTELLNYLAWPALFVLNLSPFSSNEDRLVYRMIFNAIAFILATSNLLLKRKEKERIKTPKQQSNLFSTISTPSLQINQKIVPQEQNIWQKTRNNGLTRTDYSQWMDSDEDCSMDTLPDPDSDPIRERRSVSKELTPFSEISNRLSKLTFGKENDESPLKLSFTLPASQAPKILSEAAITPSIKRMNSPFSSLKFHANSKQSPTWTHSTFSSHSNIFKQTAPSLSNGSEYNLRQRPTSSILSTQNKQTFNKNFQPESLRSSTSSISSLRSNVKKRSNFRKLISYLFRALVIVILFLTIKAFFFQ